MSAALNKLLMRVAEDVFEGIAFMIPLPEDEVRDFGVEATAASVSFEGPFQGRLVISLADQMLPALATNMLELEGETSPTVTQQHDALKELTNVVCGRLLPAISGSEAQFHVAAPELSENDFPGKPAPGQKQVAEAQIILDSGEVNLALFADDRMPTLGYMS